MTMIMLSLFRQSLRVRRIHWKSQGGNSKQSRMKETMRRKMENHFFQRRECTRWKIMSWPRIFKRHNKWWVALYKKMTAQVLSSYLSLYTIAYGTAESRRGGKGKLHSNHRTTQGHPRWGKGQCLSEKPSSAGQGQGGLVWEWEWAGGLQEQTGIVQCQTGRHGAQVCSTWIRSAFKVKVSHIL